MKYLYEKPKWFDIDKYRVLDQISKEAWLILLQERQFWTQYLSQKNSPGNKWSREDRYFEYSLFLSRRKVIQRDKDSIHKYFAGSVYGRSNIDSLMEVEIEKLFSEPLSILRSMKAGEWSEFYGKEYSLNKDLIQETLRPLFVGELMALEDALPERFKYGYPYLGRGGFKGSCEQYSFSFNEERAMRHNRIKNGAKLVEQTAAKSITYNGRGDFSGICFLSLNLKSSDDALKRDFENYLKAARKKYSLNESKKIKNGILNQLISKKVLPFIDLELWQALKEVRFTQEKIGDWLFGDQDINRSNKVKDQTIPLARRALAEEFIDVLSTKQI